jgi:hypothetical protein
LSRNTNTIQLECWNTGMIIWSKWRHHLIQLPAAGK